MELNETIEAERGLAGLSLEARRIGDIFEKSGFARTGLYQGQVIVVAGVMLPWPGLGVAWAIVSPPGRQHIVFVHRNVTRMLRMCIIEYRLRRVEANVDSTFNIGQRWVDRLGFKYESTMPCYGPLGQEFQKWVLLP